MKRPLCQYSGENIPKEDEKNDHFKAKVEHDPIFSILLFFAEKEHPSVRGQRKKMKGYERSYPCS